jgi:pre-mRNA-splicing helicase BRR2
VHGVVEPFWLIVEDADGEVVLFHQYWLLRKSLAEEEHNLSFTVPVSEPLPPQYFVRMMSDRWIGCEATLAVSFRCVVALLLRHGTTVVTPKFPNNRVIL